jgi:hypothetical protein
MGGRSGLEQRNHSQPDNKPCMECDGREGLAGTSIRELFIGEGDFDSGWQGFRENRHGRNSRDYNLEKPWAEYRSGCLRTLQRQLQRWPFCKDCVHGHLLILLIDALQEERSFERQEDIPARWRQEQAQRLLLTQLGRGLRQAEFQIPDVAGVPARTF